jgi:hypothetical protein
MRHRKLSKKAALLITRELWKWVEENTATCKADWPYWSRLERIYGDFHSYCACCNYAVQEIAESDVFMCPLCPLLGYAWYTEGHTVLCLDNKSPFKIYCNCVDKLREDPNDELAKTTLREAAGRIVAGCVEALRVTETTAKR